MIPKAKRIKDRAFLSFAKQQGGVCCICLRVHGEQVPAEELHHWGNKGMGQKCHDYEVARLCCACHREQQGKKRMAYIRRNEFEVLEALTRDALDLMILYVNEGR
jgi:hypothetical protein